MRKLLALALGPLAAVMLVACSDASFSGNTGAGAGNGKNQLPTPSVSTPNSVPSAGGPDASTPQAAGGPGVGSAGTPPANAVKKGSFTAWADPANPDPFEDYQIHIQVTLPPSTVNYQETDLTGTLNGTDGYSQSISDSVRTVRDPQTGINTFPKSAPDFSVSGTTATIVFWVPGTYSGVTDTVNISSALLSESQSLQIVFQ